MLTTLLILTGAGNVYAKNTSVCNTTEECALVAKAAQARSTELLEKGIHGSIRTTYSGEKFVRDTSNPELGEAYKDPSGLIWGDAPKVKQDGSYGRVNFVVMSLKFEDADKYCKSIGARLPTREEYEALAKYLGRENEKSIKGYAPALKDSLTEFLPNLSRDQFWTSTTKVATKPSSDIMKYVFWGNLGLNYSDYADSFYGVRCVTQ